MKKFLSSLLFLSACSSDPHGPMLGDYKNLTEAAQPPLDTANEIRYHGGSVFTQPANIYLLWYGDWSKNTDAQNIIIGYFNNLNGSKILQTNSTYFGFVDQVRLPITNQVNLYGSVNIGYTHGTTVDISIVPTIVQEQMKIGTVPLDSQGIYYVLTSIDVKSTNGGGNFCEDYCGYHNFGRLNGYSYPSIFVGDLNQCPYACSAFNIKPNTKTDYLTPNDNTSADSMVSVMTHELIESMNNPFDDSWYRDKDNAESADMCAWTYQNMYYANNGARANMKIGNRDFLIQGNWVNFKGGYCSSGAEL